MFKNDVGTCNGQLPLFCLFKLFPMFGNPPPWRGMDHVGKDLLSKADRLAPPAWQVEYSQVTRALPLSNPHVRCCARSQWRDRDGRDSSFFSHSRGSSSCKVGLLELAVHVACGSGHVRMKWWPGWCWWDVPSPERSLLTTRPVMVFFWGLQKITTPNVVQNKYIF